MNKLLLPLVVTTLTAFYSCKTVSTYPIQAPYLAVTDDGFCGKWKIEEDTSKAFTCIVTKAADKKYHIQVWEGKNQNPNYEANAFFTKIGNVTFLNVPCRESIEAPAGYLFMRVLYANADFSKMTTCTVNDTTMRALKNTSSVRDLIVKNMDNPKFYYDTVHFYKLIPGQAQRGAPKAKTASN
jgi:hypothetical protein